MPGFFRAGLFVAVTVYPLSGIPDVAPAFQVIGLESGLPSGEVYALEQGPGGFVYIATEYGLARYDGVRADILRSRPDNDLPQHNFQELFRDSRHRLWAMSGGSGIMQLDESMNILRRWDSRTRSLALPADDVWAVDESCDGRLVLGFFEHGPVLLDPDRERVEILREDLFDGRGRQVTLDILVDDACRIWVATLGGLRVIPPPVSARSGKAPPPSMADFKDVPVFSLHAGGDGHVWLVSRNGVYRTGPGDRVERIDADWDHERTGTPRVVHAASGGAVWIGTGKGLVYMDDASGTRRFFGALDDGPLPAAVTEDILEDHEGGLWFATRGQGVAYLPKGWKSFGLLPVADGESVLAAIDTSGDRNTGDMLVATSGGALARVSETGWRTVAGGGIRDDRGREFTPTSITALPEGGLVSSDGAAVFHHRGNDEVTRLVEQGDASLDGAVGRFVEVIAADDRGRRVWVGTLGMGLIRIDLSTGDVERWHQDASGRRRLPSRHSTVLHRDADDGLWVSGDSGLYHRNRKGGFSPVTGVSDRVVHDFLLAGDGIWVADDHGFHGYRRHGGQWDRFRSFTSGRSLPDTDVVALARDAQGRFWLATAAGLIRLDPDTGQTRIYDERDGLVSRAFMARGLAARKSGEIWAATARGVLRFSPADMPVNNVRPQVHLTRLRTPRREIDPMRVGNVRLDWDEMPVVVEFAALTFDSVSQVPYRLRLEGWDPDWIDLTGRRSHVYTRVPPGRYSLQLNAANRDGVWNHTGTGLDVEVLPPWWRTRRAVLAYCLAAAVAAGLAASVWLGHRRRRFQLEAARQANKAKSDFLAVMSHEIRTPLHGVLGMLKMVDRASLVPEQRERLATVDRSGRQLQRILDDILDLSRIEAGHPELRAEWFDLRGVLDQVVALHAARASDAGLSLSLLVSRRLPRGFKGDPERLAQILGNLVSNAIKFTRRGRIQIEAWPGPDRDVCFAVTDTGSGMSEDQCARVFQPFTRIDATPARRQSGAGLGLAICRQLTRAMGGGIRVTSRLGQGSRFVVTLPLVAGGDADTASPLVDCCLGVDAAAWDIRALRRMLGIWGIRVRALRSPAECRRLAPDGLIIDGERLAGYTDIIDTAGVWVTVINPVGVAGHDGRFGTVTPPLTESRLLPVLLGRITAP